MLSAIITDVRSAESLAMTLATLQDAATDGMIRELIIVSAIPDPDAVALAEEAGAAGVVGGLGEAFAAMRQPWSLVLPAGVRLQTGWQVAVTRHAGANPDQAAFFHLASPRLGWPGRLAEAMAVSRTRLGGLPSARQGLIAPKAMLQGAAAGAHSVDEVLRRIGRRRLTALEPRALAL